MNPTREPVDLFRRFLDIMRALFIDLIAGIGELFRYEDLEWEVREVEGVPLRIATPETLFRMKKDIVRPEDKRDARFLADLISRKTEGKT